MRVRGSVGIQRIERVPVDTPSMGTLSCSGSSATVPLFTTDGEKSGTVAELPLQDKVPIEGVSTGPRSIRWIPTLPRTLIWAEAQDDGDPKKKVPHRDALFTANAEGEIRGSELLKIEHRFAGLDFFPNGNRMLVRDYDRDRK